MGFAQAFKGKLEYFRKNDQYGQNMTVGSDKQEISFYLDFNSAICSVASKTVEGCSKCERVTLFNSSTSNTYLPEGPTDIMWYTSERKTGWVNGTYAAD